MSIVDRSLRETLDSLASDLNAVICDLEDTDAEYISRIQYVRGVLTGLAVGMGHTRPEY